MTLNDEARQRFDKLDTSIAKLFDLNRDTQKEISQHIYISGVRDAEMKAKADAAHDKIDDHLEEHKELDKERRGARATFWVGLALALAAALFAVIKVSWK